MPPRTVTLSPGRAPSGRDRPPVLDVAVPVHNEEADLAPCVRRLHAHLTATFPYPFRITIADNASADATLEIAMALARELPEVGVVHLAAKGRGLALRAVWSASEAPVLAYTDVDLSTDLAALLPLVAPLLTGHSDLAIGSRLSRGSRVVRGAKREVISRCYNLLLRGALAAHFSDAQCGFKAIRKEVADRLLPLVVDTGWFFDTELLVLAERAGLRIHEVPVDWVDDPDSRVDLAATAVADLRGMLRLGRALATGALPLRQLRAQLGRAPLLATATANTAANRRLTFGVVGWRGAGRHHLQGLAVFGLGLALTGGALAALGAVTRSPGRPLELAVLVGANLAATLLRFLLLRAWVFRQRGGARLRRPPWGTPAARPRTRRETAVGAPSDPAR